MTFTFDEYAGNVWVVTFNDLLNVQFTGTTTAP